MKKQGSVRLIVLMLLLTMISPVLPVSAKMDHQDKYDLLAEFGFFNPEVVYRPDMSVTRGEVIASVVNALPEEKKLTYSGGDIGFSDITAEDTDYAQIAYQAKMMGLLSDAQLRPYDAATIADAACVLVNLLGYGIGATHTSATTQASDMGLFASLPNAEFFTLEQWVVMLYNALDTPAMMWGINDSGTGVYTSPEKTYLTEILSGGKGKGIVTANRYASVNGDTPTRNEEIRIDGLTYLVKHPEMADRLGEQVEFFYRENSAGEKTVLYMKRVREENVLEIDAEHLLEFDDFTYTYESGEKLVQKRAKILAGSDIVYNGKTVTEQFSKYLPEEGSIRLIDNNGDRRYETVIITDYAVVTIGKIQKDKGTFSDLYEPEKQYEIDLYADGASMNIRQADGTVGKFSDLYPSYTIFFAQSLDKEISTLIYSNKKIRGAIMSYSPEQIVIEGIYYEPTERFVRFSGAENRSYGEFYLDPKGRIGAFDVAVSKELKAGYLIRAVVDDSYTTEEEALLLKLFTENGMEKLYTAEKLYYTNCNTVYSENPQYNEIPKRVKVENLEVVLQALEEAVDPDLGGGQLILYRLNSQGRVSEIEIAAKYTEILAHAEQLNERANFRQILPKTQNLTHNFGRFQLACRIGPDTKVISVPSDIREEKKFEFYTGTTNCFVWNQPYTITAYSKQKDGDYADYVLGYLGGVDGEPDNQEAFVVTGVTMELNEDDEPMNVIKGYWGSTETEYRLDEEYSDMTFHCGDVLRLGFDDNGDVQTLIRAFDREESKMSESGTMKKPYYSIYGYVYDLKGKNLQLVTKDPSTVTQTQDVITCFGDNFVNVYRYNSKTNRIEPADFSEVNTYRSNPGDLSACSKVFAWFRYSDHKTLIIYD